MKQFVVLFIATIFLLGCKNTTLPSDPQVEIAPLSLGATKNSTSFIYIWLPPASHLEYTEYVLAFNNDAQHFSEKNSLTNRHSQAQKVFNNVVNKQGGLFDTTTGLISQDRLSTAIMTTKIRLFEQYTEVQHLAFLVPFAENIRVVDGVAEWQKTKQKLFEHNSGSSKFVQAISLKINYVGRDSGTMQSTVGLDMKQASIDDKGRYRHVVKYLLTPLLGTSLFESQN